MEAGRGVQKRSRRSGQTETGGLIEDNGKSLQDRDFRHKLSNFVVGQVGWIVDASEASKRLKQTGSGKGFGNRHCN